MRCIQSSGLFNAICVQCTIDLAMHKDTFSRRQRKQRATTNQFRACLVTNVAIE